MIFFFNRFCTYLSSFFELLRFRGIRDVMSNKLVRVSD
ncbi:unnamed protein product [Arabidopsis halleri]